MRKIMTFTRTCSGGRLLPLVVSLCSFFFALLLSCFNDAVLASTVQAPAKFDSSGVKQYNTAVSVAPGGNAAGFPGAGIVRGRPSGTANVGGVQGEPVNSKVVRKMADTNQMPSLFGPDEELYDRYAACLAATEGLRRIRDRDLSEVRQKRQDQMEKAGTAPPAVTGGGGSSGLTDAEKQIIAKYGQNSGKVLRALGMSVPQFNELGRRVFQDEKLKAKIMEQAYLYRMAATINMDRTHLIEDPASEELLRSFRHDKVQMFCASMKEIEKLRSNQIERLKRALRAEKFPSHINISDPSLLPYLSPKVRAVVEAFPLQAEQIVKKHGLQAEEFNQMLQATRSNPIFRWKINRQIRSDDVARAPAASSAPSSARVKQTEQKVIKRQ